MLPHPTSVRSRFLLDASPESFDRIVGNQCQMLWIDTGFMVTASGYRMTGGDRTDVGFIGEPVSHHSLALEGDSGPSIPIGCPGPHPASRYFIDKILGFESQDWVRCWDALDLDHIGVSILSVPRIVLRAIPKRHHPIWTGRSLIGSTNYLHYPSKSIICSARLRRCPKPAAGKPQPTHLRSWTHRRVIATQCQPCPTRALPYDGGTRYAATIRQEG